MPEDRKNANSSPGAEGGESSVKAECVGKTRGERGHCCGAVPRGVSLQAGDAELQGTEPVLPEDAWAGAAVGSRGATQPPHPTVPFHRESRGALPLWSKK